MTQTQIRYFLEVAKNESFSRAAEELFVSHQVLSNQIKALERELDIELIDRSNKRKIRITDAGRILFDAWTDAMAIHDKAVMQARKIQEEKQNTLVIGIQDMRFVRSYVVPMIKKLQDSPLNISLEYRLGSPVDLSRMLDEQKVDMLILVSSDYREDKSCQSAVLCKDALHIVAAMSKDHPAAKKELKILKDLKDETLLMVSSAYSKEAGERFRDDLKLMHMEDADIKYIHGPRAINIAITTGVGVALIFEELLEEDRDEIKTFDITMPNADKTDMILVWKDRRLDEMARQVIKAI